MANNAELIKQRYGNPFDVLKAVERAASQGYDSLSEDDLFMCKWIGLYTHRHEKGYFMLRTKQPNGFVTADQLDTIADIAQKQNKGYADITTRQDFQLHWVHHTEALGIIKRLESVGISCLGACGDIPRNVVGCPVAGVDKDEVLDASPIARQVSDFFLGNLEYANLPRKYKISISGCAAQCTYPEIQCVSLIGITRTVEGKLAHPGSGERRAGEVGFDLRVGGGLSTQAFLCQRLNAFIKPEEALEVIRHITDIWRDTTEYREKRHHARIKYLVHDWGVVKLRQALEEKLGRTLDNTPQDYQDPPESFRDHLGVHAQKQRGRYYVGAPVLVGRITAKQMKTVADLSRRYCNSQSIPLPAASAEGGSATAGRPSGPAAGGGTIRLTTRQNILLLNIDETNVPKVASALTDAGLPIATHPIRRSVVTCTGTEFCKLAITETKARSREITEYLESRVNLDEPLRIHITGCPNACAQYQIGHIGLMGSKTKVDGQLVDAFDIFVGGQMGRGAAFNHAVLRKVPASDCKHRLEQLLIAYKKQRKDGESFNAWCSRAGDAKLAELLSDPKSKAQDDDTVEAPKVPESDGPVY